jgi:hypothetical protein
MQKEAEADAVILSPDSLAFPEFVAKLNYAMEKVKTENEPPVVCLLDHPRLFLDRSWIVLDCFWIILDCFWIILDRFRIIFLLFVF